MSVRNFINTLLNSAEDIAAVETFHDDGDTLMRLHQFKTKLGSELAPLLGTEKTNQVLDTFVGTVMGAKHEREHLASLGLLDQEDPLWR